MVNGAGRMGGAGGSGGVGGANIGGDGLQAASGVPVERLERRFSRHWFRQRRCCR